MEKMISDSNKSRENMDRNLDDKKVQIESRIGYLLRRYPDYKDIIEEWRDKHGTQK